MRNKIPAATLAVALLTLATSAAGLHWIHAAIENPARAEALGRVISKELTVQTLTATWISGGITQVLNTPERPGDGPGDLVARHKQRLQEALLEFPKDP